MYYNRQVFFKNCEWLHIYAYYLSICYTGYNTVACTRLYRLNTCFSAVTKMLHEGCVAGRAERCLCLGWLALLVWDDRKADDDSDGDGNAHWEFHWNRLKIEPAALSWREHRGISANPGGSELRLGTVDRWGAGGRRRGCEHWSGVVHLVSQ